MKISKLKIGDIFTAKHCRGVYIKIDQPCDYYEIGSGTNINFADKEVTKIFEEYEDYFKEK